MADKYQMFVQFMRNELGIDRSDIRAWAMEAVQKTVKDMVKEKDDLIKKLLKDEVSRQISEISGSIYSSNSSYRKEIAEAIGRGVLEELRNLNGKAS